MVSESPRWYIRLRNWARAHPMIEDTAFGLLWLSLFSLTMAFNPFLPWPPYWRLTILWGAVTTIPAIFRRRWTWAAVVAATVIGGVPIVAHWDWATIDVGILVMTYTAAAYFPLRHAVTATLVIWVPNTVLMHFLTDSSNPFADLGTIPPLAPYLYLLMLILLLFFVGRTVYTRRQYIKALVERAEAAEANQRALAIQAVADERRRIARELHDVVAHHVSVMGVLASGARRSLARHDANPALASEALSTIEETGRTAMRELRRLLDVLRSEEDQGVELTPQPGLAGIRALVDQVTETGLPVTLRVEGEPVEVDPGISLTVYRIVQEALTNTLKHGGAVRHAEVRLEFTGPELVVEVVDDGRGPALGHSEQIGHGLVGMRERVALYGGTLSVGPRPGGGFRVYARIRVDRLDSPGRSEILETAQ